MLKEVPMPENESTDKPEPGLVVITMQDARHSYPTGTHWEAVDHYLTVYGEGGVELAEYGPNWWMCVRREKLA